MAFNLPRFDTQSHYNHIFPITSSSSSYLNYTYNSDHTIIEGLWSGRSVELTNQRDAILRELEKERIREEIIAEELEIAEDELRRGLVREHGMMAASRSGGFPPSSSELGRNLRTHDYLFPPARYDDGGPHRRDIGGVEAVPFHRRPPSEFFSLEKFSGSKRKAPTELIREDFSYVVCPISATSARDLNGHVSGREYRANMGHWQL